MRVKQVLTGILATAILCSLAAGCGEQQTVSTNSASADMAASSLAVSAEGSVAPTADVAAMETSEVASTKDVEHTYFPLEETESISLWTAYPPIGIVPEDYLIFQEAQKRLNIQLEFQKSSLLTASDDFNLLMASGEYPDIINYFSNFYTRSAATALEQEIILDLTDYMDDYAPDYQAARTADENVARETMDDGKLLRFFMLHDGTYSADFGPAIRKDWLEEQGLDVPETYEDWHDVGKVFLEKYGATIALPATGTVQGSFLSSGYDITLPDVASTSAGGFFQVDGTVHFGPYEDSFKDYLEMLHSWYQEGILYPDFYSDSNGNSTDSGLVTAGTCGIFWLPAQYITEYEQQMGVSDVIEPIADPVKEAGQVTHMRSNSNTPIGSVVLSADCRDVELAMEFMNWWYTDEGSTLANYGVEGQTFQLGEDGSIQWTELITSNPDYSLDGALALYTGSRDSIPYLYDDGKYDSLYAEVQLEAGQIWLCNDDGSYVMPNTFEYDQDTEIQQLMGDISTYVSQSTLQFITGDLDLSGFADYQAKLERMGMEKVLDAYTQQYAEMD